MTHPQPPAEPGSETRPTEDHHALDDPSDAPAADRPRRSPGRRRVLAGAALAGAVAVGGGGLLIAHELSDDDGGLKGVTVPDLSAKALTRFGFTISNPTPDGTSQFRKDLDEVRDLGLGAVRFSAPVHEMVTDWGVRDGKASGRVRFDGSYVSALIDGLDEAEKRGLDACMMVIGVCPDESLSDDELVRVMGNYWRALAAAIAPRTPQWQVFNEADAAHFRNQGDVDVLAENSPYLDLLSRALGTARDAVHAETPGAEVTTNLFGYPVDEELLPRWRTILDRLADSVDVITVDAYPETKKENLQRLVDDLASLRAEYGKPVVLGEIGMKVCAKCFTLTEQVQAYSAYLTSLAHSAAQSVYFYKLRDPSSDQFGVLDDHGKPRPAYTLLKKTGEDS